MPDVLTMYMADLFSWLADAQSHHCYGNSCPLCTVHLSQCHIYMIVRHALSAALITLLQTILEK